MRRKGLIVAAALVVIANGIALLGVARNRATAVQRIELTERELPLSYSGREDTGVNLRIGFAGMWQSNNSPGVFTAKKLRELGFDTSLPTGERHVRRPPRVAYLAYEYEGPTWKRLESERQTQPGVNERLVAMEPHLIAVDAARSPDSLRLAYQGKGAYLIVRGLIWITLGRGETPAGYVVEILPSEIHVPLPMADKLRNLSAFGPGDQPKPRYTIRLAYGANYEPWVESVTLK